MQESAETVRVLLADKVGQARTDYSEKAPGPMVMRGTAALRAAAVAARGRAQGGRSLSEEGLACPA